MCVEMPARVHTLVGGDHAVVEADGATRRVALTVLNLEGETVAEGDWLLVHTGYAIRRLDPAEAEELVALHEQLHGAREGR
jgi:hydrogenase expression/formation protein HypC